MLTNGPFDNCDNLFHQDVSFAAGASVSSPIDTAGMALVGVYMPATWTAARLNFDVSLYGMDWVRVKDSGANYETCQVAASVFVAIPMADAVFAPFLRLQSVDAATPPVAVVQAAATTITLVFKRYLGGSS